MRLVAEPSFIVDVTRDLQTKLEALSAYRSQFSANPSNAGVIELVRTQAAMWGALGRVEAGEPFFALEPLALRSLSELA